MKRFRATFDQSQLKKLRNTQKYFSKDWMSSRMLQEYWRTLKTQPNSSSINRKHLLLLEWRSLHAKIQKKNSKSQMCRNQNTLLLKQIFYSWSWLISSNMENGEKWKMHFELIRSVDLIICYFQEPNKRFRNESTLLSKLLRKMLKMLLVTNKFSN